MASSKSRPVWYKFKYFIGIMCMSIYVVDIQYHLYFFTRYFVLEYAFRTFSAPVATIFSMLGYYLLARNIILFSLCAMTAGGSVKALKGQRVNYEKVRQVQLKKFASSSFNSYFAESDVTTLKSLVSDISALDLRLRDNYDQLSAKGKLCTNCSDESTPNGRYKPARAHHCNTCGTCCMRLDHHCPWLNNCIGLNNLRFFIQLLFHTAISSPFTLLCIYMGRNTPIWHRALGNAWLFVAYHAIQSMGFIFYFAYMIWAVKRDVVSIDLVYMTDKVRYSRIVNLNFPAKLYLIFGTPSLPKALFFPCARTLPLNGLEFEHEEIHGHTVSMEDNFEPFQFHN